MDERDGHQRERLAMMQHAYREELVERIGRVVRRDGVEEPLPGLHLARSSVSPQPLHSVVEPSICVIAQGSIVSDIRTPHTSIVNIKVSLASLLRAMCSGCEAKRSPSLGSEKGDALHRRENILCATDYSLCCTGSVSL